MIITLTTDFGTADPYAGIMKGVILSKDPHAVIIDITHEIAPQDVSGAAYALYSAFSYFPENTLHVAVVDPGVGTGRNIVAAAIAGHYFLAPDNGLLSLILASETASFITTVENDAYFLSPVSRTFHGRDIFASVAGHLSNGLPMDRLGFEIKENSLTMIDWPAPVKTDAGDISGVVIMVDRFGNLITNINRQYMESVFGDVFPDQLAVGVGDHRISGLSECYGDAAPGTLTALVGSSGLLEIAVSGGNASRVCDASTGSVVTISIGIG